jgi:hypothetical protein
MARSTKETHTMKKLNLYAILAATGLVLSLALALPAAATTKCLCNNGKVLQTTRKGERGCNSACKILGGGGRVWVPEDEALEGDGTVVRPRRGGPARPRR